MNPPEISVVLPLLNEEDNIGPVYEQVRAVLVDDLKMPCELVFVDDGSTDGSWEAIRNLNHDDKRVRGIRLVRNFGHQQALRAGLEAATGNAVVMMDCDLQHPPALIEEMVKAWREGYQVVNAVKQDNVDQNAVMKFLVRQAYRLLNVVSDGGIQPGASDFRLIDKAVVGHLRGFRERHLLLRTSVNWLKLPTKTLGYIAGKRHSGISKYTFGKLFYLLFSGLASSSVKPLRMATVLGFLVTLGAIIYAAYILYLRVFSSIGIPGWTASVIVDLFIGGTVLVVLGVIGEYVALIYEELKARPSYIVHETI